MRGGGKVMTRGREMEEDAVVVALHSRAGVPVVGEAVQVPARLGGRVALPALH